MYYIHVGEFSQHQESQQGIQRHSKAQLSRWTARLATEQLAEEEVPVVVRRRIECRSRGQDCNEES